MGYVDILGAELLTFILFTCVFAGGMAFMTGNALAGTWRPMWQNIPYAILLGAAERFFNFALFGGELLSVSGFIIDTAVLMVISLAAYRATIARKMTTQYAWAYERAGLFSWRTRRA